MSGGQNDLDPGFLSIEYVLCLEVIRMVFRGMSGGEGLWKLLGRCLQLVWRMSGYTDDISMVAVRFLYVV